MSPDHPDLFEWKPEHHSANEEAPQSGALIVPFPQRRNIGKARHVAKLFTARRSDLDRESYWRQVCDKLAGSMRGSGIAEHEIASQIEGFRPAVSDELGRMQARRPGGVA